MRQVTQRFTEAIAKPHRLAARAEILDGGVVAATIDTVISGTVTLDSRAAVRGRCAVTVIDDGTLGLVPDTPADDLAPYGNEIRLSRGITYPDDTTELVALGVFGIQSIDINDTSETLTIQITGLDRAQKVIDARFEEPYTIAAGTDYLTALEATIAAGVSGLTYDFASVTRTTPLLVAQEGDDRWAFCQEMAKALGMTLFFDGDGTVRLIPLTSPTGTPVVTISEGDGGVLLNAGRAWTREGTFNRVIATGENTGEGTPARGVATDDNPLSPTYYYGPFGKVPRFYSSPFITTDAQAVDAAAGMLAKELGTTQTVQFGAVVNPALEPEDIALITRDRTGIDENHIIDSLTIPLEANDTMSGTTRAVQVTS